MKKLNVMQKLIAFIAACVSLVAVFALSGSGYSEWTHIKGGGTLSEPVDLGCGVTVWYHSVTVYDNYDSENPKILWQKNNYTKGETVTVNDMGENKGDPATTLTLAKAVYDYLENKTFGRACLTDENGTEICSFKKRTNETEYLTIASGQWVLNNFHGIDLTQVKDYKFYIKMA